MEQEEHCTRSYNIWLCIPLCHFQPPISCPEQRTHDVPATGAQVTSPGKQVWDEGGLVYGVHLISSCFCLAFGGSPQQLASQEPSKPGISATVGSRRPLPSPQIGESGSRLQVPTRPGVTFSSDLSSDKQKIYYQFKSVICLQLFNPRAVVE